METRNIIALGLLILFSLIGSSLSTKPRIANLKWNAERENSLKLQQLNKILLKVQDEIAEMKKNVIPIGFTYVQLPNEKPPSKIFSGMKWKDVSSDYAGIFFRVEGGNSSAFGQIQEEDSPRLIKSEYDMLSYVDVPSLARYAVDIPANGEPTPFTFIAPNTTPNTFFRQKLTVSNGEVRPKNMAMRVWRRVK